MDQFKTDRDFWALLVPELYVSDLDISLKFYCDIIGFTEKFGRPEERFAYVELGQAQLMLDQIPDDHTTIWKTGDFNAPLGRGINFQIEVQDVQSIYQRCVAAELEIFRPLQTAWYREENHENGQTQFLIQDPDGYLLRFMQHLGQRDVSD
ncbi:MAG: VOC family protein [Pseudomonadota bacterium]